MPTPFARANRAAVAKRLEHAATLHRRGWSLRRIGAELGVSGERVRQMLLRWEAVRSVGVDRGRAWPEGLAGLAGERFAFALPVSAVAA